ncbi:MAG TPA: RNA polymerase sigma factor [Stenotrophomonas sp.]|nr:RNA polymerase sigma factor [Stenotrophomonas sp.]
MLDATVPALRAPQALAVEPDDDRLARAAAAGDRQAFEAIYRRHSPRLYAVVWRLCGGQAARADDVLQDAFIRAWRALPQFRFESALATWLHRLAVNTALMDLRARSAEGEPADEAVLAELPARESCQAQRIDLERALQTLPPRARAVLVLHDVEGWKHQEIAEVLQMAVGSSKAQLHRARGLLRVRMGEPA